jgi:hypothetical protein
MPGNGAVSMVALGRAVEAVALVVGDGVVVGATCPVAHPLATTSAAMTVPAAK